MDNIRIAKETISITKKKEYAVGDKTVKLPEVDPEEVIVISPEDGARLLDTDISSYKQAKPCRIRVVNADSFQAGRMYENPLVMNFANAHNPGGGFLIGATAQEEALCRCSTLYASITSKKAAEMYRYNNTHLSRVESDHMLISPNVVVFRDEHYEFIDPPVVLSVITLPAPNRYGAALLASDKMIGETFIRRIRIMLLAAMKYGYKNLVLGAWGCGAFGNPPLKVADYFKEVIISRELGKCFDEICFAIYGKEDGENITAFRSVFE